MDLTLIRHAEAAKSETQTADPPLTERGIRQAALLAERAAKWKKPTAILASPALRAKQTALPLAAAFGLPIETAAWLEEVRAPDGAMLLGGAAASEHIAFEAMHDLRTRVSEGLERLLARFGATSTAPSAWTVSRAEVRVLLIGHGMAHAIALEWLLGIPSVAWAAHRFQFAHAGFASVRAFPFKGASVFGLTRYNDVDHIARDLRTYT
jgi:broad specificity phosphatase PhoE